ncbi:hypothetical protein [Kushneria phosphatilytica]|uniref:hypothetical protein n=1 Tax=Kushneria phosphatilytica TaxID=657387 RepID=UPI000AA98A03|nr:hypothetical protein [Kushneria phosphatilytica]
MLSPFALFKRPHRAHKSGHQDIAQVSLEREGRDEIRRITAAVEKVPWSVSTLQILWTAGPVTLIGAWGGYLLGYGKAPSMENYVFFISYTVITGVAGIIANLVYHLTRGRHYERTANKISHIIDELPELILTTRNLIVESLEGEARRREAAAMLLRKQDLSPQGVELAALELLDDHDSARIIAQIDVYRRVGLHARIQDMIALYRDTIDPQLSELNEVAPEAIALLRDRFAGHAPDLHHGVARDDNFIERVMAAIEEDNELLMTLQDVEEMLILAFELISGREIPMLTFEYRGRWQLARTLDALEEARSRYRISQATGLSRLKALTVYLAEQSGTLVEDAAQGLRAEALAQRSREAMDALAEQIHQLAVRSRQGEKGVRGELRDRANILTNALKLFRSVHEAYEQVGRNHVNLLRMSERWDRMAEAESDDATRLQVGPGGRGLRIREKRIELDDAAKAQVCKHLFRHLRDTRLPHRRIEPQATATQDHVADVEAAKRLAIEIALALEPHVQLSRPEVQRAIYASNAAYFGQLEPNLSASAKAALGTAMVKEVNEDLSRTAESLALALVRHYRVALPPEAIDFLKNTYGAREGTLNMLSNYDIRMHRNISLLTHRPPLVGSPSRHWYRALVRARRALN